MSRFFEWWIERTGAAPRVGVSAAAAAGEHVVVSVHRAAASAMSTARDHNHPCSAVRPQARLES